MSIGPQKGWLARQQAAQSKLAAGISDHLAENMRIAGERLQAERESVAALEAEAARIRAETACPCPSCNGGKKVLSIEEAAYIATAVEFYRSHRYTTDPDQIVLQHQRIANPDKIVVGKRLVHPSEYENSVDIGAYVAAQAKAVETDTAEEAQALAEVLIASKPKRR